jgi:hypothetical protein
LRLVNALRKLRDFGKLLVAKDEELKITNKKLVTLNQAIKAQRTPVPPALTPTKACGRFTLIQGGKSE